MIVRILTEGQYELAGALVGRINAIDNEIVSVVHAGDEPRFKVLFAQLLDLVRQQGRALPGDALRPSDAVLPPPDTTIDEAKGLFVGEGLIPG